MMLLNTLKWRIVLAYAALIVISMGAVSIYLINFVQSTYISNLEERLEQEASMLGESSSRYFEGNLGATELQALSERIGDLIEARVTIITLEGTVIADTWEDPILMPNHSSRPEVQGALTTGIGMSTRVSITVGQELMYTAIPIEVDGIHVGISRIAVPISQVKQAVNRLILPIALSAIIVTSLSIALGYLLARRTSRSVHSVTEAARRLANGDLEQRVEALASDETRDLANAFNSMATALRKMIDDLSMERNKLSAVLDTMADGVVVIRQVFYLRQGEGLIELINPAAEELLSLKSVEAVGSRFMETVNDHEIQKLVHLSFETGEQQHGEIELMQQRRSLSAIATPLTSDGPNSILLTLHDLTLIHQADSTRRQFVSNVSHELRSPLASIKAMVETLESGALEEKQVATDFIHRIHIDIERMSRIVEDLLELSRLESGQVALELTPMDVRPLMEEVKHEFQLRAEAKEITLKLGSPDSLPLVMGERNKLHQVLANLLDNALKFTPENGAVTLYAIPLINMIQIYVSDTGIGIAEEHHSHIFERFYRVDSSRQYRGTGLGLAIAKHIAQAHGGEIAVESHEGEGSTFSFTVPVVST
jgi:two-component system phosphate regulon sensor histidine kinase PhoR